MLKSKASLIFVVAQPSLILCRFSKLFMAHLDTEFKKQSDPGLKSLIEDQVRGKRDNTYVRQTQEVSVSRKASVCYNMLTMSQTL